MALAIMFAGFIVAIPLAACAANLSRIADALRLFTWKG